MTYAKVGGEFDHPGNALNSNKMILVDKIAKQVYVNRLVLSFFEAGINTNIDGKDESELDEDEITEMLQEKFGDIEVEFI